MQPIILYAHTSGPNPPKVRMILEELELPYETKVLQLQELKQQPYLQINPNGRVPAIIDPNQNITLWESGAIIEYLVETYDVHHKISFDRTTHPAEYFHAKQWLHFQMSGQGPYFGQAVWFKVHHPEFIQSAYDRYVNEIRRVSGFLNKVLEEREYLVGNRYSYADIAFVIWFNVVPFATGNSVDLPSEFPHLSAWLQRMEERPAIKKVLSTKGDGPKKQT